jgi:hypothetical protein
MVMQMLNGMHKPASGLCTVERMWVTSLLQLFVHLGLVRRDACVCGHPAVDQVADHAPKDPLQCM